MRKQFALLAIGICTVGMASAQTRHQAHPKSDTTLLAGTKQNGVSVITTRPQVDSSTFVFYMNTQQVQLLEKCLSSSQAPFTDVTACINILKTQQFHPPMPERDTAVKKK